LAVWLLTLSVPDCAPPEPLEGDVIRLTSVNDGPVKQVAYDVAFCSNVTVKGPRTSVSRVCHAPVPGPVPDGPDASLESVLMQSGAVEDGADDDVGVGVALQPA
jgi:hypothetical protein